MKIHVLDPALITRAGHHFHVALAIRDTAAELGIETVVHANRQCNPDVRAALPVAPAFTNTTYSSLSVPAELSAAYNHLYANQTIERELLDSVRGPFAPDDLIVVHTVVSQQLVGLYRWYVALPEPRPRICLLLRFQPWFRCPPPDRGLATAFYEKALRLWTGTPGLRVVLTTDNAGLGDRYAALGGCEVTELPIPIRHAEAPPRPPTDPDLGLHFVFMGEARLEKGFHLLMGALTRRGDALSRVRFTAQACRAPELADFITNCRRVMPDVRFVMDDLSEGDYLGLLSSADGVIVPYDPNEYELRTSHVLLEALGMGKPVLTTRGTWMEREMERFGKVGVSAGGFDVDAVLAGLEDLAGGWRGYARAARDGAARCRDRHNPRSFVRALLAAADGA